MSNEETKTTEETVEVTEEETPVNSQTDEEETNEESSAETEIAALKDRLLRSAAEFDNFKKRTAREKEEYFSQAVCDTISAILPVLDNLTRAAQAAENGDNADSLFEGVKMIEKQFNDALAQIGVSPIEAVGKPFDPDKHNAVMTEPRDDVGENIVIEELQKGYEYGGKVVRYSMVKVSG